MDDHNNYDEMVSKCSSNRGEENKQKIWAEKPQVEETIQETDIGGINLSLKK